MTRSNARLLAEVIAHTRGWRASAAIPAVTEVVETILADETKGATSELVMQLRRDKAQLADALVEQVKQSMTPPFFVVQKAA